MNAKGWRWGRMGWMVPMLVLANLGEDRVAAATDAQVTVEPSVPTATSTETSTVAADTTNAGSDGSGAAHWSALYVRYMAVGTVGDCASCHAEARSAAQAYAWLATQQYMTGSSPYLVDPRTSCFSWLGGDMPPDGPNRYARATNELTAWAAAGAKND